MVIRDNGSLIIIIIIFDCFLGCKHFKYVPTNHGICQSYNPLPVKDIYKKSQMVDAWTKMFESDAGDFNLTYSNGRGPFSAFYIVLNDFESYSFWRKRNGFILSITNEENYFDVIRNYFVVEPGYLYSFEILPSQISTTPKFEAMNREDRNCGLFGDSSGMNHTTGYSKSGCELECGWVISTRVCTKPALLSIICTSVFF